MNSEDIKKRTRDLAHYCFELVKELNEDPVRQHFRLQLVRCSTSLAANYQAACLGQSRSSFIAKLSISIEEVDEIKFWVTFMAKEQILSSENCVEILKEADELSKILCKSRITARINLEKNSNEKK